MIAIGQFFYAIHYNINLNIPDVKGVPKMLRGGYGGMSRFLTYWCLVSKQNKNYQNLISQNASK